MSDPRNDRPDRDAFDDRPFCEDCGRIFDDAKDAASTDGFSLFCAECTAERAKEAVVEAAITGEAPGPMTTVEAMGMAVETALGAATLLNGGGAHPDDEDEPETVVDVHPLSTEEAAADLKGRGAA